MTGCKKLLIASLKERHLRYLKCCSNLEKKILNANKEEFTTLLRAANSLQDVQGDSKRTALIKALLREVNTCENKKSEIALTLYILKHALSREDETLFDTLSQRYQAGVSNPNPQLPLEFFLNEQSDKQLLRHPVFAFNAIKWGLMTNDEDIFKALIDYWECLKPSHSEAPSFSNLKVGFDPAYEFQTKLSSLIPPHS